MRLPWTELQPSARERRWLQVARAGALVGAVLATFALLRGSPPNPLAAVVVVLATLGLVLWPRERGPWQVGIADDGSVLARRAHNPPERSLQCVFVSRWLITLRVGTGLLAVWPDSLPPDAYRRLWVHLRWTHAKPPAPVAGADDGR